MQLDIVPALKAVDNRPEGDVERPVQGRHRLRPFGLAEGHRAKADAVLRKPQGKMPPARADRLGHSFQRGAAGAEQWPRVVLPKRRQPFDLADRAGVRRVRLRANSICWRKENLARIGVAAIPDAQYLALVDGDMLFHDPLWVEHVLRGLQIHPMVQISSDIIWLGPKNEMVGSGKSFMHW